MKNLLFLVSLTFLCNNIAFSQQILGVVLDGKTNEPIESATIYFDNTTIGTVSNVKGEFKLDYNEDIKSPLVISFLGYETQILNEFDIDDRMEIFLFEAEYVLDEVVLYGNDDWSRAFKLKEFKKHYLGQSLNGRSCKILNEDDISLWYDKRRKRLTAKSKNPIFIKNRNLKYEIVVSLNHFEVDYSFVSKNKKRLTINKVYYSGANFYRSLQKNPTKATIDIRKKTYEGSVLHFMRALSQKKLKKNGYQIYLGNQSVSPGRYISVIPVEGSNDVAVRLKDRLNIRYSNGKQSSVESFVDYFYIDHFGNHSPPDQVRFGGDLGFQRMGDALPLDFLSVKDKRSSGL